MANNDTNRQLTAGDIKGDLAQRLRCPGCTRTFAQVEGRNRVELDRNETLEGSRKAITFVCNECKETERAPVFAFRMVGGLVQEIRVDDLPNPGALGVKSEGARSTRSNRQVRSRSRRGGKTSSGRRTTATTPTETPTSEDARTAAASIAPSIEEEE